MENAIRRIIRYMIEDSEIKSLIEQELENIDLSEEEKQFLLSKENDPVLNRSLSRIYITDSFRIFLPDYGNAEIIIKGLQAKTVYLLYLIHHKGIANAELSLYRDQMIKIYSHLSPYKIKDDIRACDMIDGLLSRAEGIYEANNKIKAAFRKVIKNQEILNKYIIDGQRKNKRKISLPRHLIDIENHLLLEIIKEGLSNS